MNERTSDFINVSRWLAAFVVVASHVRQIVFCDYADIVSPTLLHKVFYFVALLGHEAVMVFFVLSGYLIGGTAILRLQRGFDLRDYAAHRTARIYSAFLPALVIFGLLDLLGAKLFGAIGLYTKALGVASLGHIPAEHLSPATVLGNAIMLQAIAVSPLGSNGPLWSLANEVVVLRFVRRGHDCCHLRCPPPPFGGNRGTWFDADPPAI